MKITILTYGSRGDFQPFLALGVGLQQAGHRIRLAGPGRFAGLASKYAVPFAALAGDPEVISARLNDAGTNPIRVVGAIKDYVFDIAPQVVHDARIAIHDADLIIHTFLFTTGGHSFAREMGIPDISVETFPMFAPTRSFPNVAMAGLPPGVLSWLSHWIAVQVFWYGGNSGYRSLRRRSAITLPEKLYWPFKKVAGRPLTPLLLAVSPSVLPRPADWTSPHIHQPGYFFLDEPDYSPPAELREFLAVDAPPVCVSFGSMVNREAMKIGQKVLEALECTHQRGVILTGWGGWRPDHSPKNILYMESAPHDWLFPRCSLIIHHGGAGTTAAGLRSGRPNIVVPFAADQPFWGKRVTGLGAGPLPLPVKHLEANSLASRLETALSNQSIRQRAAEIGDKIRGEHGVADAVQLIESWAAGFRL